MVKGGKGEGKGERVTVESKEREKLGRNEEREVMGGKEREKKKRGEKRGKEEHDANGTK